VDLIPHDELKPAHSLNFAPMIDFLFLLLALFATLAISRAALYDAEVELVEVKPDKTSPQNKQDIQQVNLSLTATGDFKWLTEFQQYSMENLQAVQTELARQYQIGALPQDKSKTEVLLHIDRRTPWEPIAKAIFAIRELGFSAHPVYEPFSNDVKAR
jgi:biopolymer transport protein ExbD